VVDTIPSSAILLAVDGGLDAALAAGLRPSGLIGDLDSVSPEGLAWAEAHATIARHPTDKDQTDTELALAFAADMQPERLTMIGGGDRLDHTVAALGALAAGHLTNVPIIDGWWNGHHIDVIHGPGRRTLHLRAGSLLSLLAIGPKCRGVVISGVRWPLEKHELDPVVGLGISNTVTDPDGLVPITVSSGVLTVFDVPVPDSPIPTEES
jgi:thiamine pyrophosphokinase